MHKDLVLRTPSLAGSTELLVIAPIKPGFVPALDAVTYTSRAKLLLRALHAARKNSHEYNLFRAVSDAVERVGVIHSLRVAVLEPDAANPCGSILLSVNFDGAYEAYVRTIWQKSARLLDLIFCNTVGHVTGWDHPFDAWNRWLQSRQVDTPFFYGTPSLTKADATALRMQDRFQRRESEVDLMTTRSAIGDAEHIAWDLVERDADPQSGKFALPPTRAVAAGVREGIRQGLQGLAGVYRLAELYSPADPSDDELLRRAAYELLPEFARMWELANKYQHSIREVAGSRLEKALDWFETPPVLPAVRQMPPLPDTMPTLPGLVQAGILAPAKDAQRACVCLVAFDSPAHAARFLQAFKPTSVDEQAGGTDVINVALTFEGLRACGVPEPVLDQLPIEFRQGMQRRAGLLGDVQANHPRRWSLPVTNWPHAVLHPASASCASASTVALEAVHALVHWRTADASETRIAQALKERFDTLGAGVRPLSVQWLRREFRQDDQGQRHVVDHFGYQDGMSDPTFAPDDAFNFPNQVHLGEALVGRANAADASPELAPELAPLLVDASYLVVRKLRQDVAAFEAVVGSVPGLDADLVKAKLVGRRPDGTPLIKDRESLNDFNFDLDPLGAQCPFAAHIRRANPRTSDGVQDNEVKAVPGARPPRLFRRGMSYTDKRPDGVDEKGLFFMAFNASIGEQFEVVQRWLSGGNSSGAPSGAADPICGVPEAGRKRYFRFEEKGQAVHLPLDGDDELGVEAAPLVQLAWGAYFLAPSLDGLAHLAGVAAQAASAQPVIAWSVDEGRTLIERLSALDTAAADEKTGGVDEGPAWRAALDGWKAALEDPESRREFRTASAWAAIRDLRGGLLRTTYGVLVAGEDLVQQVLTDANARYSVCKYQERLARTIGPIFLGLDPGEAYDREATALNEAIEKITFDEGYALARRFAIAQLDAWVKDADKRAADFGESRWELNLDIREFNEHVLARLLEEWFGLQPTGELLVDAGFDWADFTDKDPARYPGAFYTPSRHTFQPQPTTAVESMAVRDGTHLRKKLAQFLELADGGLTARVTRAVLDELKKASGNGTTDYDLAARTIAGAIMGFVPTTDNNLRRVMDEWLRDETLWQLRSRVPTDSLAQPAAGRTALFDPLMLAMMLRPMPEFIWRTARNDHEIQATDGSRFRVRKDDRVVLGLISATHQGLERGDRNVLPVFGGDRWPETGTAPRHACPARHSAMGVMAGVLSAIVDSPRTLRPASSGALLSFEGPVTFERRKPSPKTASRSPATTELLKLEISEKGNAALLENFGGNLSWLTATKGTLLAWGDSWIKLNHPFDDGDWDLARSLARRGWDTDGSYLYSDEGMTLRKMSGVKRRTGFYRTVRQTKPRAILIDGGGNDVHQSVEDPQSHWYPRSPLHKLAAAAGATPELVADEVQRFIDKELRGYLDTVLENLVEATEGTIPVFVIGYDHPIPDGRKFNLTERWLNPVNDRKLYTLEQGRTVMRLLIDELNRMIGEAVRAIPGKGLHHINLTGTLAKQDGYDPDYDTWWVNELHPTERGHDVLAAVIDEKIMAVVSPP